MKFEIVKNMLKKVAWYESELKVTIKLAPDFIRKTEGDTMDTKVPQYIIIKDDEKNYYWCLKLTEYGLDYLQNKGYITNKEDIINNYHSIWSGSNLSDSKEICENDLEENGIIEIDLD